MKALSVRQPWATLLARGIKDVENRTWPTRGLAGWVVIHASSGLYDVAGAKWIVSVFPHLAYLVDPLHQHRHFRGALIGHAKLIGCLRWHAPSIADFQPAAGYVDQVAMAQGSMWFQGPFGHVFTEACQWDQQHVTPWSGRPGYFEVPDIEVNPRYLKMMKGNTTC